MPDIITTRYSENGYPVERADEVLAMNAANLLHKHFPGHLWAVHVNSLPTGGVMVIKNMRIAWRFGMVLHLRNVYGDPQLKCVLRAGGELLERARLKRGHYQGVRPTHVEGLPERYQPRNGMIF